MPLETATITFDLADQLGVDFDVRRTKVWITTNADDDTIIDSAGNKIRLGSGNVVLNPDGTGTLSVWKVGQTGLNPLEWQTTIHVDYPDRNAKSGRQTKSFGPFTISASNDLAKLVEQQEIPPTYLSQVTGALVGYVEDAEAAKVAAEAAAAGFEASAAAALEQVLDVSNISTSDDVVSALVKGTAGAGPKTRAELSATFALKGEAGGLARLHYLNAYANFFGGKPFVTGQNGVAVTLTSAVSAGASVLPVSSATNIVPGEILVVAAGTAQQKLYEVASVASNNVTIVGTTAYALANGASVSPLWTNADHLTAAGYTAFAHFIVNAKDSDGNDIIQGPNPKVTFLGDSWVAFAPTAYTTELTDKYPAATGVSVGVGGNTAAQLIARFATDVPADSDYVVFNEPGVNDIAGSDTPIATQLANLAELVRLCRKIGAIPIFTGPVPLSAHPGRSADAQRRITAAIGDGTAFPGTSPGGSFAAYSSQPDATSLGVGPNALRASNVAGTGGNTAFGVNTLAVLTTGLSNSAFGYQAGWFLSSGGGNTMMGERAMFTATTASNSVAIGRSAGYAVTTGGNNTFIGEQAGNYSTATTTGGTNTYIGWRAGGAAGNNTAVAIGGQTRASGSNTVSVGAFANVSADNGIGIGANVTVAHNGAVAIGRDSSGGAAASNAANDFVLGTANHRYRMPGLPTTAPSAGSGILWNDAGVVKVA